MTTHEQQLRVESPILFEELIVEILSRVSVKALIRFKCVCKSWNTLITSPSFIKLHLHRSTENYDFDHLQIMLKVHFTGFHEFYEVSRSVRSLFDHPVPAVIQDLRYQIKDKYFLVGSCNGLFCMIVANNKIRRIRPTSGDRGVYVWNAATRLISQKLPAFQVDWYRLVRTTFGFGYDIVSDTYKVVAVHSVQDECYGSNKTEVEIYIMGESYYWRRLRNFPHVVLDEDAVCIMNNGTLNWVALYDYANHSNERVIVSFDLGKETWKKLLLPSDLSRHIVPKLVVLRDYLCVWHDLKNIHFVLWQMKEYGHEESWTQLLKISYLNFRIDGLECVSFEPLCMAKNGDVLMLLCLCGAQWMAIRYNLRDDIFKHSRIPTDVYILDFNPKVFIESLVMPC
ncbi:hypothetical protein VNO77_19603 [Canavalia gladiata]|uniref:F-box domain-containing protein n=1 Tax=Canavalia gladiata TaxID=3824 RepID=A0AAN9LRL8_CANGL